SASWICLIFFFFNSPATSEIFTLSLHDALPISEPAESFACVEPFWLSRTTEPFTKGGTDKSVFVGARTTSTHKNRLVRATRGRQDRKSTRLNSSHVAISYAVFCLKKKKNINTK